MVVNHLQTNAYSLIYHLVFNSFYFASSGLTSYLYKDGLIQFIRRHSKMIFHIFQLWWGGWPNRVKNASIISKVQLDKIWIRSQLSFAAKNLIDMTLFQLIITCKMIENSLVSWWSNSKCHILTFKMAHENWIFDPLVSLVFRVKFN